MADCPLPTNHTGSTAVPFDASKWLAAFAEVGGSVGFPMLEHGGLTASINFVGTSPAEQRLATAMLTDLQAAPDYDERLARIRWEIGQ